MTNYLSEKWSRIEGLKSTINVFSQPFPMLPQPQPPPSPRHFCLLRQSAPEATLLAWLLIITISYPKSFFSVTVLNHLSVKWMGPWECDTSWKNSRQRRKEFKIITMWLRLSMRRWIRYWSVLSFLRILANSCYLM